MPPPSRKRPPSPRAEPLLARPGARYVCHNDGLCCTDAHALGSLSRDEVRRARLVDPSSVVRHGGLRLWVLTTGDERGCVFLGEGGCRVHGGLGGGDKPVVCRRFPYGLVATPSGGRVTTEHRCPCRTLGDRPPIDLDDARRSLLSASGRPLVDRSAPSQMPVADRLRVSFARYEAIERELFASLSGGDPLAALASLGALPLPPLDGLGWADVGHLYRSHLDGTSCGEALAWFGEALLVLSGENPSRAARTRPWSPAFDRAEARSPGPEAADAVLSDWAKDALWGLAWVERGGLDRALYDVATRLLVARHVTATLVAQGARADRAAAEALLVVELAGEMPLWSSVVRAMKPPPRRPSPRARPPKSKKPHDQERPPPP